MSVMAQSYEPRICFLNEPTADIDVTLRREMWQMPRGLRENGVAVILTTHYMEGAEEMADYIAVGLKCMDTIRKRGITICRGVSESSNTAAS